MNVQGEASPKAPSNEVRAGDSVHCEGFAHGGMSSGQVHLGTWRERLLPMLANRVGDSGGE